MLPSCVHLGQLHQRGKGVDEDEEEAKKLFEQACKGGEQAGCEALKSPQSPSKTK